MGFVLSLVVLLIYDASFFSSRLVPSLPVHSLARAATRIRTANVSTSTSRLVAGYIYNNDMMRRTAYNI
jgi:hypothetical protein